MTRLPRFVTRVLIACSVTVPLLCVGPLRAQEAAPAAGTASPAPAENKQLREAVENFWHWGKVARYDLALAEAQKVLQFKDKPGEVLEAFEAVAGDRKDDLDRWLIRWQGVDQLREPANQITSVLNEGRRARRADPKRIQENVEKLNRPGRPYMLAVQRLRESGELAVPIMVDYLRDPSKAQYSNGIRDALRDLRRAALNPLLAATEMKNTQTLLELVNVIGDIGYNESVPYLARLAKDEKQQQSVRTAAASALSRMGVSNAAALNPADAFYDLAEKYYYDTADVSAQPTDGSGLANVWFWDEKTGLVRKQVPQPIFNELMSMRCSEYAMKLGASRGDALSLWLAGNYKREVELPQGATDPTREANQPSAHFYGVDAGPQYLNAALGRTLRDRDWAVAFKVVRSLQEIIGNSTMYDASASPLVEAMAAPDRPVRFEAAIAVASALPAKPFTGQERVAPLLSEALAQTGTASVVVVMPTVDIANNVVGELKKLGFAAVGAASPESAVAAAAQLPAIDVLLVTEEIGQPAVDQLFALAARDARLSGATRLVITKTNASPYAVRANTEAGLAVTQATDAAGIKAAAEAARAKATAMIDAKAATEYALKAGALLQKLATSRSVIDLSPAHAALLGALQDARAEVVKQAGLALAWIDAKDAQGALLRAAGGEKAADEVKISLYKSLAANAKSFGKKLGDADVAALDKVVESGASNEVKAAAAEARGALNLPPDQAKQLIIKQSKV